MRFAILLFAFLITISFRQEGFAQIRKIPANVTDAFKYKYRNAESVEWKDKLSHYVVSFILKGDQYEANFKNDGTWSGSQKTIGKDDLPSEVEDGLDKSKYAEWDIDSYFELIYPDEHLEYRLIVRKSDLNKRDLTFTDKGRLLKDKLTL
jgi:Putative beta-lactamase-inhibitor-like, PepSY-like